MHTHVDHQTLSQHLYINVCRRYNGASTNASTKRQQGHHCKNMAPLKILIVGCGIAGSTLASFLILADDIPAKDKPHIAILERSPTQRSQGQNIDVRGAGIVIAKKLGLEGAIRASTTGEVGVKWVDEHNAVWAAIPAAKDSKLRSPTAEIEILRGRLAELCYLRARTISEDVKSEGGAGIDFIYGDYLQTLDQDGDKVVVTLKKSGRTQSYDIVVGADGLQSQIRRMVWGAEGEAERVRRLGAYGGFFSIPRGSNDDMWRRWFHSSGRRNIMLRPDKQNNRTTVFMFVVNEEDRRLREVAERGREGLQAQKDLLEEYFHDVGWESRRVLDEMHKTQDFYYDMIGQVKMDQWSKGRVVLLGDAGHCASPFSGMGTTLALDGAYNLAGALLRSPDYSSAFEQYEKVMRPVTTKAQKLVPGMPHILSPETAWGVWALNCFCYFVVVSGLPKLLFRFIGPPADTVKVEDYGFAELPEWTPDDKISAK